MAKLSAYVYSFTKIWLQCRNATPEKSIHFTPLFRNFIPFELQFLHAAKKAGHFVILDLRAGTKKSDYETGSPRYRRRFDEAISLADAIAVEGERFVPFLQEMRPDLTIHHLPNFILDAEIPASLAEKPMDTIRFVYVGAVNEAKGVRHSAGLVKALHDKGFKVKFDVFGRVSKEFKVEVMGAVEGADIVEYHGPRPYGDIQTALSQSHFFLFLSHWYGEGHSNALTEAMSQGCIPIVTDHGFSKAVSGDAGILVDDREDLVGVIAQIEKELQDPSSLIVRQEKAWRRVKNHFSESAVSAVLSQLYETRN